jgi:hypothetical protein
MNEYDRNEREALPVKAPSFSSDDSTLLSALITRFIAGYQCLLGQRIWCAPARQIADLLVAQSCDEELHHASRVVVGVCVRADAEVAYATHQPVRVDVGDDLSGRSSGLE